MPHLHDQAKADRIREEARNAAKKLVQIISVGVHYDEDELLWILTLREECWLIETEGGVTTTPDSGDWANVDARIVEILRSNAVAARRTETLLTRNDPCPEATHAIVLIRQARVST
jgi:hypothetical protein